MGNMPVIKDLIVDMDAVHWKKIQRVTPWLINKEPVPEREYIVPREAMVDVTQSMACIQCGACVSDCLSMEVDPLFIGPAALAKAYRFVGDPRDDQQYERLKDLAEDPHGIYDCTHCFKCIDACPKGVAPMSQIMRLRRRAERRPRHRGPQQRRRATSTRSSSHPQERPAARGRAAAALLRRRSSTRGRCPSCVDSLPVDHQGAAAPQGDARGSAAAHSHKATSRTSSAIYDEVEGRDERVELNLYITGYDEDTRAPTTRAPRRGRRPATAARRGRAGQPGRAPRSPSR